MLRMRKQGDEAIFTLKTDAEIVRGGLRCREVEERIPWGGGRSSSGWILGVRSGSSGRGSGPVERIGPSRRDRSGRESTPMDPVRGPGHGGAGPHDASRRNGAYGTRTETHSERLDDCIARMETFLNRLGVALRRGRAEIRPLSRGASDGKAEARLASCCREASINARAHILSTIGIARGNHRGRGA